MGAGGPSPAPRGLAGLVRPQVPPMKARRPWGPARRHGPLARLRSHLAGGSAGGRAAGAVRAVAAAGRYLPAQAAALGRLLVHRGPAVGAGAAARGQREGARAGERPAPRGSPRPSGWAAARPRTGTRMTFFPVPHTRYPLRTSGRVPAHPLTAHPRGPEAL